MHCAKRTSASEIELFYSSSHSHSFIRRVTVPSFIKYTRRDVLPLTDHSRNFSRASRSNRFKPKFYGYLSYNKCCHFYYSHILVLKLNFLVKTNISWLTFISYVSLCIFVIKFQNNFSTNIINEMTEEYRLYFRVS